MLKANYAEGERMVITRRVKSILSALKIFISLHAEGTERELYDNDKSLLSLCSASFRPSCIARDREIPVL